MWFSRLGARHDLRQLLRGVKRLTITVEGQDFTHGQPGWWAAINDPADTEGQLTDDDTVIRAAARREDRANARQTVLSPLHERIYDVRPV